MLTQALTISLVCLAVHALFWEGMVFFRIGKAITEIIWLIVGCTCFCFTTIPRAVHIADRMSSKLIKPLFDCLICMSSFWTLIIGHCYFHMSSFWTLIIPMLLVCAMNVILDSVIYYLRGDGGRKL